MTPEAAALQIAELREQATPPAFQVARRHAYDAAHFTAACWLAAGGASFRVGRLAVQVLRGAAELECPGPVVLGRQLRWG